MSANVCLRAKERSIGEDVRRRPQAHSEKSANKRYQQQNKDGKQTLAYKMFDWLMQFIDKKSPIRIFFGRIHGINKHGVISFLLLLLLLPIFISHNYFIRTHEARRERPGRLLLSVHIVMIF